MATSEHGNTIHLLGRDEVMDLIGATPLNQTLKNQSNTDSIIPIFHYGNCLQYHERKYIVSIDQLSQNQITGILTYTVDKRKRKAELISIGVLKKGEGTGSILINTLLESVCYDVTTIVAKIYPDDLQYEERWRSFLKRKISENHLRMREKY